MPYGDKEYEEFMDRVMGDATQIGIAVSQLLAGRKTRILGSLAKLSATKQERYVLTALAIVANCEILRETYFKEQFGKAKRIMKRQHKLRNYAKREITRGKLIPFMRACQIVLSMEEISYGVIDTFFDQVEVLTTMGLRPPQRKGEEDTHGVGWLAADQERLEAVQRAQHAAEDRAERVGIIDGSQKGKLTVKDVFASAIEEVEIEGFIDILEEKEPPKSSRKTKKTTQDIAPALEPETESKPIVSEEKANNQSDSPSRVLLPLEEEEEENGD